MKSGKISRQQQLGPPKKFVNPSRRVIVGTVIGQAVIMVVALGFTVHLLLEQVKPARRAGAPSRAADWAIPIALVVAGELARRWTNRRLMSLHEGGIVYMEQRTPRAIAWGDIERAELGAGRCRLWLRGGEEIDLPRPLAESAEVREAIQRARAS